MTIGRIPSVEGGIQPTIVDAKGDLIAATAADTVNRLAVGSNDQVLVADSSASTGLAWKSYGAQIVAGKNAVINGGLDIWQRGTSIALTTTAYTADRWQGYRAVAGSTVSRQTTNDSTNLPFIQYCARIQRDSGNTATNTIYWGQSIETINSIPLAGKTVTLSFYARAGANYSSASSALSVALGTGTGTDQNFVTVGYTGNTYVINTTATLTTTWQRFTYTATLASTTTEIGLQLSNIPVGTAGAADYYEVTGVQIEVGSVATPFSRAGGTLQGELAACQRYYYRIQNDGTGSYLHQGSAGSATVAIISIPLKSTMRVTPTAVDFSSLRLYDLVNAAGGVSAVTLGSGSPNVAIIELTSTGMTTYRPYYLLANTLPSFIGFSAEL